jgi:hypothetical protein
MRFKLAVTALVALAASVAAQDTMWIYSELALSVGNVGWARNATDTSAAGGAFEVDTGTTFNGSAYIDFNYTMRGWYAGYGIVWDNWNGSVDNTGYNGLSIAHKGPDSPLKVSVSFGYVDTTGGVDNLAKDIMSFPGSSSWIRETQTYGDAVPRAPIQMINFIVGGGGGTTGTSAPGNFKLDEVAFVNTGTGARMPIKVISKAEAARRAFVPKVNGVVTMNTLSLNGALLAKKVFDVTAGTSYSIPALVSPAAVPSIINISGAGVDMKMKNW